MSKTNIAWTDYSLNPYHWRCQKTSPGCKNCYMMAQARKYGQDPTGAFGTRWPAALRELRAIPDGAVVFVNSMSDTYYEAAPDADVHAVHHMALVSSGVTFLVLTKRPERAFYLRDVLAWPANLWLGVSVETADYLWRIDYALATPAAGVFISAEPLLGDIGVKLMGYLNGRGYGPARHGDVPEDVHDLGRQRAVGWVICGGESGPDRRPFEKRWAASVKYSCVESGVPFFFKQGSAFKPGQDRELEGRTWDEVPAAFGKPVHLAHPTPNPSPQSREGSQAAAPVQLDLFGGGS